MTSRYREIAAELRRSVQAGEYPPGTALPRYEDLTATYGVGRGVIRAALSVLEQEGLITVTKKRGIIARAPGERRCLVRGNVVTRDSRRGYVFPAASRPDEQWVAHGQPRRGMVPVPAEIAELLDVEPGSDVLRRRRVTSPAGESPFQLVDTWIAPSAVADAPRAAEADTGPGGYLDRLEEAGHGPISWTERTRVRMPVSEEARMLEMSVAMPVLEVTRVGVSARTEQPVEVTICVIPADRVEIVTELQRDRTARWPVPPV